MSMIQNYGELKTEVANWLDREDQTLNIPGFIRLAETKIYGVLRSRENEFQFNLTEADLPINPITLPDNFREMKLVTWNDKPLQNISAQEYQARQFEGYDGESAWFTIIERELYLQPFPTVAPDPYPAVTINCIYYGSESIGQMAIWPTPTNPNKVPESDGTASTTTQRSDTATTRLLLVRPDVYLYGALSEAYKFLREPDKAAEYKSYFVETVNDLTMEDANARFSGSTTMVSSIYHD